MNSHVTLLVFFKTVFIVHACPVYLTLSTNSLIQKESTLTVNWGPDCNNQNIPAKIRIYSKNPYLYETPSLEEITPDNKNFGKVETNLKLGEIKFPRKWNINDQFEENIDYESDSYCLNFFILSFNHTNHVISFNCMKINPQWMTKNKELWLFPLKQLVIPGTHCSGCYMTTSNMRRRNWKNLEIFQQRFNVWQQLVLGIRYLDFSVGYFRSFHETLDIKGRFWVFNENHEITPIFSILEDILHFCELSKEIVIINFSNFVYGFHEGSGAHEIFKKLLQNTFGHIAVINMQNGKLSSDLTIQQLKTASKYVLILYNYNDLNIFNEQKETILWPQWNHNQINITENVANISTRFSEKIKSADMVNEGWILEIISKKSLKDIDNNFFIQMLNESLVNVISLNFAFLTNIIDISLNINNQRALSRQNFITIDF
ncbi:hypothetical protein PVAND_006723 [Polypedilum vanderplanki]|uniref:Phosphatidylinositol-specific phospholipase C X domain-containing protein n=1 Tax=Polypedilum vanderplanki TaxID=319348 RepID=A0A9J6C5R0_POLVA|nr:hypothetical protein PVAND_006723 [Polypedilum vanderplanki]